MQKLAKIHICCLMNLLQLITIALVDPAMLVKDRNQLPVRPSDLLEVRLVQNANEILQGFSSRTKNKEAYLTAQLDPLLYFKIQLKFSKTHLLIKGSLFFTNGKPVPLPDMYQSLLLKKIQQRLPVFVRFFYSRDLDTLVFQSSFKFDTSASDPINMLASHFKSLVCCFPQVLDSLCQFGITKKRSKAYLQLLTKRLKLLTKTVELVKLSKNQQQNAQLFQQKKLGIKGSVFKYCTQIQEIQKKKNPFKTLSSENDFGMPKAGGYFQIQKKHFKITKDQGKYSSSSQIVSELAVKKLKKEQEGQIVSLKKIEKQLKMLYEIQNPQHSLAYWVILPTADEKEANYLFPKVEDRIYMDYVQDTLDDCIYGRPNSVKDIVNVCQQIVEGVNILQESGIVHRDLKPENILIEPNNSKDPHGFRKIKIIDFGESSLVQDKFKGKTCEEDILGSTLPYSPLECYICCEEGFNSTKIDLWSVGLLLYQTLFKKNPLTYSKCFASDIYRGWRLPEQFSIFPSLRPKRGFPTVQIIFTILTLNSVCVVQKDRMGLRQMRKIVSEVEVFLDS